MKKVLQAEGDIKINYNYVDGNNRNTLHVALIKNKKKRLSFYIN